ncbi:MAG: M48 family metalloprotease [Leptolyngbyaceae cyanobacterium bins.349]|nr:M48 family metalloprotease [Leptolyngbyaceae cyanobacterium bins.349]
MTSPNLMQAGVEALQQKRYSDAVQALEQAGAQAAPNSKEAFQTQMWLVRAYQENGQGQQAIALCNQMAASPYPQVQTWAQRILPRLQADSVEAAPTVAVEAPTPAVTQLSPEASADWLERGNKALKMRRFAEAVTALAAYCAGTAPTEKDYAQAQMWLVKAYKGNEQPEAAIALCQQLCSHEKEYVQTWAKQFLQTLGGEAPVENTAQSTSTTEPAPALAASSTGRTTRRRESRAPGNGTSDNSPIPKAGRSPQKWVRLGMKGVAANLAMASGVTLTLLFGMVMALCLSLLLISGSSNPTLGLAIAVTITLIWNLLVFFLAPILMDWMLGHFGSTRWTAISEIDRLSPETGRILREVCQQKNIAEPRLGIVEDDNPTAFTYGSLPSNARLVVSRGLFKYLDDDEIATVYAHELGHIVHWDFAVMTLASTLLQIAYLIYSYIEELASNLGDNDLGQKAQQAAKMMALAAFVVYTLGVYLVQYLSRTREYYADHFAAEVTGNPNGLSRALVKIAYGVLEVGERDRQPSKLLQSTRTMGIADSKVAGFTGTAYRVASEPARVGRVFLWDLFNPWAWWMELNSTHPLTGKRVRALSTYAEQLGLTAEFEMAKVIREGRSLSKRRLYGDFVMDVLIFWADWLGLGLGLLAGIGIFVGLHQWKPVITLPLLGFGVGTLVKTFIMYPDFNRAAETDVLTLMSDPYASPLRGRPVKLSGTIIGRGDAGYRFGSDLKLQDPTGMIYLYYASRFGPLGNFLFGMTQAASFINQDVQVKGWFRRGVMPIVDLIRIDCDRKWTVNSYHRFWMLLLGVGAIGLAFVLPGFIENLLLNALSDPALTDPALVDPALVDPSQLDPSATPIPGDLEPVPADSP